MKLSEAQNSVIGQLKTAKLNGSSSMAFDCGLFKTSYSTIKALVKKGLISTIKHDYKNGSVNWVEVTLINNPATECDLITPLVNELDEAGKLIGTEKGKASFLQFLKESNINVQVTTIGEGVLMGEGVISSIEIISNVLVFNLAGGYCVKINISDIEEIEIQNNQNLNVQNYRIINKLGSAIKFRIF